MTLKRSQDVPKKLRVEVEWIDIVQAQEWVSAADVDRIAEDGRCRTVGYVEKITRSRIFLRSTASQDEGDLTVIPIGCIVRMSRLAPVLVLYDANKQGLTDFPKQRPPKGTKTDPLPKTLIEPNKVKDMLEQTLSEGEKDQNNE
jgi:hypothetical protein